MKYFKVLALFAGFFTGSSARVETLRGIMHKGGLCPGGIIYGREKKGKRQPTLTVF